MMKQNQQLKINTRYLIAGAVMLLAVYVIVPQIGDFKSSLHLLSHPGPLWTLLAVIFTLLTYFAGALTYKFIAFKPLNYFATVLVQFGAMFVNRLLPAGLGALGANFIYLKHAKHSNAQATTVVTVNNLLGGIGHNLILVVVVAFTGYSTINSNSQNIFGSNLKYFVGALALAIFISVLIARERAIKFLKDISSQIIDYRNRPLALVGGLGSSLMLTSFNVLALYACAMALGISLTLPIIMIIFTFGIGVGSVTPTPGGLGGFEAGLAAGFIAFNVDGASALAIALLYRLISYWLTLIIGAVAFVVAQRKQLI